MQRRLRLGMVGGGQGAFIGGIHRIAARLDDDYEFVAGALSRDPALRAASMLALRLDPARCYDDYREMARAEAARADGIDVVAVVTPNYLHAAVASAFLEAGIHVICDKPLAISLAEGVALEKVAKASGKLLAVTQTYSGYPMVRHARALVESGEIGELRLVQVEYAQDWLAEPIEHSGNEQAAWRTDPQRAGPAGCLGDIGTHAYHLASFVTGVQPEQILADLSSFVPGRPLDDHVQIMMRYANGARGALWASQVASGSENGLRLRLFGSKGNLDFRQESPNELWLTPQGGAAQRLTRGRVQGRDAVHASRTPAGHPEGYLEAFAQLYRDAALHIHAIDRGLPIPPEARLLTTVSDGVAGLAFIEAALQSHRNNAAWVSLAGT